MTIFLTGFPGFIAGRLVEKLARADAQFFLLVQPQFVERAALAVERIAHETGAPLNNFYLLEGDITTENLGLSAQDAWVVRNETTDVFHLAAVYDLDVDADLARRVNVEGTRNVNALVGNLKSLHRYNYVSTCYVAGKRTGTILETELEHSAGFRNAYEETKYLAEISVERLKAEAPTTIYRPSVVVGDSKTGETVKYDGIYSLILYLRKMPALLSLFNIGNDAVRLNLVPVDFVVNAIAALATDERAISQTLHLADPNPLTTGELFDTVAGALTNRKSSFRFPAALVEKSLMMNLTPRLSGLPHSGVPYFFLEQIYDSRIATKLLAAHGVRCPNFRSYVKNLIAFVEQNPDL